MAKLPRKTQKIFCSKPTSENQTSVFGTMKTADKQYSTDVGTLQSNAAYEQGWKSATITSYKPFMEDFNTLNYINTSQLAYLFQQGIPEWDEATAYYKNSFCSYNGDLWKSLIDDNLNNTPLEGESWTLFTSGKKSGGGLELCDIGMALYVDETKGLRRYLNGQIVDINTNTQVFLNRLLEIKTTNPDYFTTEANWQAEKAMNIDGCVYKFVLNYDNTGTNVISVRLPKYPEYIEINNNSVNNTAPVTVYGNGMSLGLTNGTTSFGLGLHSQNWNNQLGNTVNPVGLGSKIGVSVPNKNLGTLSAGVVSDPSKSGLTGTASITSDFKQTKLKLYYFIQIATGSETENNIVNDIELNNPFSLFDSKYSDHELNNLSWLKSSGQWNAKAVYTDAYDKLLKVHNGTETVEGLSVKLSTETYTDYDFVLNTADETFRLPLLDGSEDLPSDRYENLELLASGSTYTAPANGYFELGKSSTASGQYLSLFVSATQLQQALVSSASSQNIASFLPVKKGTEITITYSLGGTTNRFRFIYAQGNGSLYFYVGETVQNANLIDAGRIGEQLAKKTDMLQASGASMPSNRYIDLTLGASGSNYTAPANGWFIFSKRTNGANQYVTIVNSSTSVSFSSQYATSGYGSYISIPVKKGDNVNLSYSIGGDLRYFRFIYAEGSK